MAELIWDGKYDEHGNKRAPVRIELPFQTVETVNESAQERQRTLELSSSGHDPEWRNRLIWGDKKYVLPSLLPEFAGKVDLIYIDPPFDTGADFSFRTEIPETEEGFTKEPSILEQKAYRDTWGKGLESFVAWLSDTLSFLYELLKEGGSIYLHLDEHADHYGRVLLDEVFGVEAFKNQIAWKSTSAHSDSRRYGSNHQAILFYVKGEKWTWNEPRMDYDQQYVDQYYRYKEPSGRAFKSGDLSAYGLQGGGYDYEWHGHRKLWRLPIESMKRLDKEGKIFYTKNGVARLKSYLDEANGMPAQTLWIDKAVQYVVSWGEEKLPYDTQKSEGLLKRIIEASSNERDLVLDCFCGSGTTAAVAEKLNRRWIACDLGRFAIHTTRKRLLGIPGVKPFVVQNLGKYERQAWQVAEFASPSSQLSSRAESRDPMPAGAQQRPGEEFSAESSGANALPGRSSLQERKRSFDSAARSASASTRYAQDDRVRDSAQDDRVRGSAQDDRVRGSAQDDRVRSSAQDDKALREQREREAAYPQVHP